MCQDSSYSKSAQSDYILTKGKLNKIPDKETIIDTSRVGSNRRTVDKIMTILYLLIQIFQILDAMMLLVVNNTLILIILYGLIYNHVLE